VKIAIPSRSTMHVESAMDRVSVPKFNTTAKVRAEKIFPLRGASKAVRRD
jgi:hypothetical protein